MLTSTALDVDPADGVVVVVVAVGVVAVGVV
jgi:hypothetical protein